MIEQIKVWIQKSWIAGALDNTAEVLSVVVSLVLFLAFPLWSWIPMGCVAYLYTLWRWDVEFEPIEAVLGALYGYFTFAATLLDELDEWAP